LHESSAAFDAHDEPSWGTEVAIGLFGRIDREHLDALTAPVRKRWFLGAKSVNAFRQRIFGPQRFKTRLGNQNAIKRSF
jgi:hypothetical protein